MEPTTPLGIVRSLTLWPVYGHNYVVPALGVGWTLSFELLFYAGFALALASRASLPLMIFGLCLVLGLTTDNLLFWFVGSPLTFEFLMGVAIARMPTRETFGGAAGMLGLISVCRRPSHLFRSVVRRGCALSRHLLGHSSGFAGLRSARARTATVGPRVRPAGPDRQRVLLDLFVPPARVQAISRARGVCPVGRDRDRCLFPDRAADHPRAAQMERGARSGGAERRAPHITDAPLLAGVAPGPAEGIVEQRKGLARN
jgi:hypothetical protein